MQQAAQPTRHSMYSTAFIFFPASWIIIRYNTITLQSKLKQFVLPADPKELNLKKRG
jgi:hypothetical protein